VSVSDGQGGRVSYSPDYVRAGNRLDLPANLQAQTTNPTVTPNTTQATTTSSNTSWIGRQVSRDELLNGQFAGQSNLRNALTGLDGSKTFLQNRVANMKPGETIPVPGLGADVRITRGQDTAQGFVTIVSVSDGQGGRVSYSPDYVRAGNRLDLPANLQAQTTNVQPGTITSRIEPPVVTERPNVPVLGGTATPPANVPDPQLLTEWAGQLVAAVNNNPNGATVQLLRSGRGVAYPNSTVVAKLVDTNAGPVIRVLGPQQQILLEVPLTTNTAPANNPQVLPQPVGQTSTLPPRDTTAKVMNYEIDGGRRQVTVFPPRTQSEGNLLTNATLNAIDNPRSYDSRQAVQNLVPTLDQAWTIQITQGNSIERGLATIRTDWDGKQATPGTAYLGNVFATPNVPTDTIDPQTNLKGAGRQATQEALNVAFDQLGQQRVVAYTTGQGARNLYHSMDGEQQRITFTGVKINLDELKLPVQSPALRAAVDTSDPQAALDALATRTQQVLNTRDANGNLRPLLERDANGRWQLAEWIPTDVREVLALDDGIVRYDFAFTRPQQTTTVAPPPERNPALADNDPFLLPQGDTQVPRLNPRVEGDVTIATRQLLDIKTLPQATRDEVADFLVRSNPESYADRTSALNALNKADQIYVLRDAQGGILGTATLRRTGDYEWYLGQVAAAPRSGAGGDVMKWLLGDFKQLARNSDHEVRIWAYTNKAENVYNARDPSQPGFYAQLGAEIIDSNPAGTADMTTRRRIDIEWRFDANGNPVRRDPTPPQTPPVVPNETNTPQANVAPLLQPQAPQNNPLTTVPPTQPQPPAFNVDFTAPGFLARVPPPEFTFPTEPTGELTFTIGTQPFQPYDPALAATTLDQFVLGTAAAWNQIRPIEGTLKFVGRGLGNLTRPVSEWVVNIPNHVWNALPESTRTQLAEIWHGQPSTTMPDSAYQNLDPRTREALRNTVVISDEAWDSLPPEVQQHLSQAAQGNVYTVEQELRQGDLLRQAPLELPLGIGSTIEWVFVGRNGNESLVTKIAKGVDRLWQTPPVEIAMGTAKAIGFLAHRGTTALMVIEAAAGGPKLHLYNPTTNQPITEPSLEALTIGYVPKTDGTIAVTLQGSLVPDASITFWASGPVMRNGIPRIDRKVTGDLTVDRIISTWQANLGTLGVVTKVGDANVHWARGITVRPAGEIGANPLVGQASTQRVLEPDSNGNLVPKDRGSLDVYSLGVIDPMGFIGTYDTVRLGPIAITPDRNVVGLGSGYTGVAGTSGLTVTQTPFLAQAPASAFQTNPAFNWQMREKPPLAGAVSVDGERLQAVWSVDADGKPKVGLFVPTQGAFQIESGLYVDPATGWMAVASPVDNGSPLWVHYDVANAAKLAGQARNGSYDAAAFQSNWRNASADQMIQALQTSEGRAVAMQRIVELALQRSPQGSYSFQAGFDAFAREFTDPTTRRLIESNAAYFRSLLQPTEFRPRQ
jgi:hypothetical protein